MDSEKAKWAQSLGLFSLIVSELVGFTLGGLALGYGAHSYFGWPVWLAAITGLVGFSLGLYQVVRLSKKYLENEDPGNGKS